MRLVFSDVCAQFTESGIVGLPVELNQTRLRKKGMVYNPSDCQ